VRNPSFKNIRAIANAFEVRVGELFTFDSVTFSLQSTKAMLAEAAALEDIAHLRENPPHVAHSRRCHSVTARMPVKLGMTEAWRISSCTARFNARHYETFASASPPKSRTYAWHQALRGVLYYRLFLAFEHLPTHSSTKERMP
jgi:hypothetical protein